MNWATIREAIRQAVISATGIQDVQWKNNPQAGLWRDGPHVDLVLSAPQAIGTDLTTYAFDVGTGTLVPSLVGDRKFTVSVRIENTSQIDGEESVGTLAGLLRTRLRRAAILKALRTGGVALSRVLLTKEADFTADDREVSLSVTDVLFLAREVDTDTTDPGDYIAAVAVASDDPPTETLRGEDGNPLPDPAQMNEIIEAPP